MPLSLEGVHTHIMERRGIKFDAKHSMTGPNRQDAE